MPPVDEIPRWNVWPNGKARAAIVGPGNIGTDLMYKLLRSDAIEPRCDDRRRPGVRRACSAPGDWGSRPAARASTGCSSRTSCRDLIFEATSATVHREYAPRYEEAGIRAVDLTPAAVGPAVIPPVNGDEHVDADEHQHDHLRRPGDDPDGRRGLAGRAGVVRRDRRVGRLARRPARAPAPTSTSSPAPPPRASRDRRRRERQGDHHPQPGRAADDHARHDLLRRPGRRRPGRDRRVGARGWSRRCRSTSPATGSSQEPQFDDPRRAPGGQTEVSVFIEVEGAGDYLPPYAGNLDIMTAAAARVGEHGDGDER